MTPGFPRRIIADPNDLLAVRPVMNGHLTFENVDFFPVIMGMGFWCYSARCHAEQACPPAPFRRSVQIAGEHLDRDAKVAVAAFFKTNAVIHGMEELVLQLIHNKKPPFLCVKRLTL